MSDRGSPREVVGNGDWTRWQTSWRSEGLSSCSQAWSDRDPEVPRKAEETVSYEAVFGWK
jgi:hypothetical protein